MGDDNLLERLRRLNAKVERGEELTDEEVEQLQRDMEQVADAAEDIGKAIGDAVVPAMREFADAMEPMREALTGVQVEGTQEDSDA